MGFRRSLAVPGTSLVSLLLLASFSTGCQTTPSVSARRLIAHQAMIDFSGLNPAQLLQPLKLTASIPQDWEALPLQNKALYVHQQWRSPSRNTGVGAAYIHLPIPIPAKMVVWFAKLQYAKQLNKDGKPQGQLLNEFTDSLGREWFEAQNDKYRIKGYALTNGFDAWIIYSGYKIRSPFNPTEFNLAARSMESILPTPIAGEHGGSAIVSAAP